MKFPTKQFLSGFRGEKGSLLIVVLCFLFIMSVFALAVGAMVRQRLLVVSRLEAREKLRYIAEAGVKKGAYVIGAKGVEVPTVDTLTQSWSNSEPDFKRVPVGEGSFTVYGISDGETQRFGLIDEESKINLNKMDKADILSRLFQNAAGTSPDDSMAIALSILDWRDADEDSRDLGAETRYYMTMRPPYPAKNGEIGSLSELLYIKGITPFILAKIRPYVTLDGTNRVNINTASKTVLLSLGVTESLILKIQEFRRGRDKIEGTPDDGVFDNAPGIAKKLQDFEYLDPSEVELLNNLSPLLEVYSTFFTVDSVAQLNHRNEALSVHAVINRLGEVKRWQEEFLKISS